MALFWEDRWLHGFTVQEIAPRLYDMVLVRAKRTTTVHQAVTLGTWATDVGPEMDQRSLQEYLHMWTRMDGWQLEEGRNDIITWAWETDGTFSARSAYAAKFWGREVSPTSEFTWKSKAPLQCRFFTSLALRNICWTPDRVAACGLPHQDACPFCAQEKEPINHLLLECVFARETWTIICRALGKPDWAPGPQDCLNEWCIIRRANEHQAKDSRAIMILVMWVLWKHRNAIVFDGDTPSQRRVISTIEREARSWSNDGLLKSNIKGFLGYLARWTNER